MKSFIETLCEETKKVIVNKCPKQLLIDGQIKQITVDNGKNCGVEIYPNETIDDVYNVRWVSDTYLNSITIAYGPHKLELNPSIIIYTFTNYTEKTVDVSVKYWFKVNKKQASKCYNVHCNCDICLMLKICDCDEASPCMSHNTNDNSYDCVSKYAEFQLKRSKIRKW